MNPEIDYSEFTSKSLEELRKEQEPREPSWKVKAINPIRQTEAEREYWEKIRNSPDPHAPVKHISDAMRNIMKVERAANVQRSEIPYDDAKQLLWRIIQQDQRQRGYVYNFSDCIRALLPELLKYFLGDPESKFHLHKGIYLWGNVGRGKTQLFRFFDAFTKAIKFSQFNIVPSKKIVYDISKDNDTSGLEYYFTHYVCFDDLGFEEKQYKHYGNELRVMETILEQRYNRRIRTHATSNVPPDHLGKYYDDRIVSRCSEMFNFIEVDGIDHRKQ